MKIPGNVSNASQPHTIGVKTAPLTPKANISFKSVYDAISIKQSGIGFNLDVPLSQIAKVKELLQSSKIIEAKDLLLYQLQISELNMRVELLSKAADGAVSLTRKLQNAQ